MSKTIKPPHERELFGHPVGLYVLFFTELWERFSYYGMRALFTLFLVAAVTADNPGYGWTEGEAYALYGWYTMLVYVASIPGGILADQWIGQKKAVMVGGLLLCAGHGVLAVDALWAFYAGCGLIILGVGCLKPNISTMVGGLYKKGDERRDIGFYIFYIGINVGAFLAGIIIGTVGENINWHYGFGLAGIGMFIGQLVYVWGQKFLVGVGDAPPKKTAAERAANTEPSAIQKFIGHPPSMILAAIIVLASIFGFSNIGYKILFSILGLGLGIGLTIYQELTAIEKDRVKVLMLSFIIVIVFWGAFEQAGGLMNVYAKNKTNRVTNLLNIDILFVLGIVGLLAKGIMAQTKKQASSPYWLGGGALLAVTFAILRMLVFTDPYEVAATVFQSVNAFFIFTLAAGIGAFWYNWKMNGRESSSIFKMAIGVIIMGWGFFFMTAASMEFDSKGSSAMYWLVLAYLFHTIGELCASPVALSFITKLAPARYAAIMMGIYFAATGLGNKLAGVLGEWSESAGELQIFTGIAIFCTLFGLLVLALLKPLKRLTHGAEDLQVDAGH